jgi:cytochrome P450
MPSRLTKTNIPVTWLPFWTIYSSPLAEFKRIMMQKGDLVKILTPWPYYLISEPDLAQHILIDDETLFTKKLVDYKIFENYVGRGILTKEGDQWEQINDVARPFFKKSGLERQTACIDNVLAKSIDHIEDLAQSGKPVDIGKLMARITFDIVAEYIFGVPNDDHDICDYYETMDMPKRKALNFFLPTMPGKYKKQIHAFQDRYTDYIDKMGRLSEKCGNDSLYAAMQEAFDRDTLINELKVLLFGGHTTLASLLTWAFYSLSTEPDAAENVYNEIDDPSAGKDMKNSELMRFLFENMRLYPPVWLIPRRCIKTHEFNGMTIRKGRFMLIAPWSMNRNPAIWPDPEAFRPQRFLELTAVQRKAFIPFSMGKRQCMGKHFALLEAYTIVSTLLQHFFVLPAEKREMKFSSLISVKSRDRLHLYLQPRQVAATGVA